MFIVAEISTDGYSCNVLKRKGNSIVDRWLAHANAHPNAMATRVKKQPNTTSKEVTSLPAQIKNEAIGSTTSTIVKKTGRSVKATVKTFKGVKKSVQLKAKSRVTKKTPLKINPKNFARVLMENSKGKDGKKMLLKNGGKEAVKKPRQKPKVPKIKQEPVEDEREEEEQPPVLEPIFEDNLGLRKSPKKRGRKSLQAPPLIDIRKIKMEPSEESGLAANEDLKLPVLMESTVKAVRKPGRPRKPKIDPSSIDEGITDLSFLIDSDHIKRELVDCASESSKADEQKIKKLTKKQRLELLKKDFMKKENIENTLRKLEPADFKVIDRLDLNVHKAKTDLPKIKRRHSIERFPTGAVNVCGDNLVSVFSQMPRAIRLGSKRSSPYSTRSDSPARQLRNGKHRKLKDLNLLAGLESPKRRKRVYSDMSGSETASKLSGYESDSSFSDLASLHGSEKDIELSKTVLDSLLIDGSCTLEPKSTTVLVKPVIDTNSNLCTDAAATTAPKSTESNLATKLPDSFGGILESPSAKVPQKGLLLDIMKQTFNDLSGEKSAGRVEMVPFYGRSTMEGSEELQGGRKNEYATEATSSNTEVSSVQVFANTMPEEDELRLLLEQTDPNLNAFDINKENFQGGCVVHSSPKPIEQDHLLDQAPVLEKQVLNTSDENISIVHLQTAADVEHLDPPVLEMVRPVAKIDQKKPVVDDHKIGIAVTEKDNVVLFSIEHLTDDAADQDVSNEDLNHSSEDKTQEEENADGEEVGSNAELIDAEKEQSGKQTEGSVHTDAASPDLQPSPTEIERESCNRIVHDIRASPSKEVVLTTHHIENQSKEVSDIEAEEKEYDKTGKEATEKGCDKNDSEINGNEEWKGSIVGKKQIGKKASHESAEELAKKESILNALGLQSLKTAKGSPYPKRKSKASAAKSDPYTGTLKTVIKINKKKRKNSLKMTLQKSKGIKHDSEGANTEEGYHIMKESGSPSSKHNRESSDSAGAHRKSHYSNRSNMDGSSEQHTSEGEQGGSFHDNKSQPEKSLIVPEKASSFSIHPGRLCKDECSYCFGKFGLFDTPCHIAQIKSVERQNKILSSEKHLTRDSCLCDACYRHVDRKSNSPSYINKSLKRNSLVAPGPRQNHCHVLGCNNVSSNILRRKWIIKMRKSICQAINIDLDNPGLHSIPICDEHFSALEHLMICAMCKRRLARNHIHYLGPEVQELNEALKDDGIPIVLSDKPVVCKLCRCFASIILKDPEERMENSVNFFKEYKKRLLHFNDATVENPSVGPDKGDKKDVDLVGRTKKRTKNFFNESEEDEDTSGVRSRAPSTDSSHSQNINNNSPDDGDEYEGVDYNTLIPAIAMECPSDNESKKEVPGVQRKMPRLELLGSSIEISRVYKNSIDKNRSNDLAAQKLGQNPSISLKPTYAMPRSNDLWQDGKPISTPSLSVRQLFPGEEELGLMGEFDFKNTLSRTPEGWEKCTTTIQYDEDTKLLWQELQKPYGSQSSFLRHLVLLEKYFRNGDLILSPTASHHAINYRESVHNRLRAYDNLPTGSDNIQPPSMVQFNKMHTKSSGGGITNHPNANGLPPVTISQIGTGLDQQTSRAPITLQQLNQPPLYSRTAVLSTLNMKNKPPGLISINQNVLAPGRPLIPGQKIKFPITKNWRPNLIPIDPAKKSDRKPGLVQVISGGKPYHITLEDYKKMCAIKRSFEAKQKKIQEQQQAKQQLGQNSILKMSLAKKGVIVGNICNGIVTEGKSLSPVPISSAPSSTITSLTDNGETILDKLDKQVERLGRSSEPISISAIALEKNPAIQLIPRIPKSLTVIPQTIHKDISASPQRKTSSSASSNGEDSNSQS
ncbi:uncharacterized protein east isoform X2 [Euwallacea fornicatus]|uniref:uncharacterized protein east isoform X2 n=1 Tax=Euwallacea fornicatus TaxID=995702 RepID=UPI00338E1EFE